MRPVIALAANQERYVARESAWTFEIREVILGSLTQDVDGEGEAVAPLQPVCYRHGNPRDQGTVAGDELLTVRQVQKMYVEHFARWLLVARASDTFRYLCCYDHHVDIVFPLYFQQLVGGGVKEHTCQECTHRKRHFSDFEDLAALAVEAVEAMARNRNGVVVEVCPPRVPRADAPQERAPHLDPNSLPVQEEPGPGIMWGWVHIAVMDGKTMVHRICAVKDCRGALLNYRDGRFCEEHIALGGICGVNGCELAGTNQDAMTCGNADHMEVFTQWQGRFFRESFLGIHRGLGVCRALHPQHQVGIVRVHRPQDMWNPEDLDVGHTFRVRHIYCLQTLQWACGVPIGFGKCYGSESTPQVCAQFHFSDVPHTIWPTSIHVLNACSLLCHMARQNINEPWLDSTCFIVDAWHYINHQLSDLLCRTRCNPSPRNGSQPDLLLQTTDPTTGRTQAAWAFNTEAAEQLNAWLDGFEAQLRQMSDFNYDFTIQVGLLLYKEKREREIDSKGLTLLEEQ
ncbi:hypothetical protein JB92DRAFT_2723848 [Gautieria morchelliformis]|nr:hypothetical protein JB92DRAFT_2723848 [Gautieria morchelliformis]